LVDLEQKARCLRNNITFVSLNDHPWQFKQQAVVYPEELYDCMDTILSPLGLPEWITATEQMEYLGAPTLSFYCCAHFAASREAIRAVPLEFWKHALNITLSGGCYNDRVRKKYTKRYKGTALENFKPSHLEGSSMEYSWHLVTNCISFTKQSKWRGSSQLLFENAVSWPC
jgi:hypothetical protein